MCVQTIVTYIPVLGPPWNTMRGGLCHARKANMKTSTQAALTERVNSGLRPPTDGSIMAKGGGPGTGGRSAWTSDTVRRADVSVRLLQAIGGAAASLGGGGGERWGSASLCKKTTAH